MINKINGTLSNNAPINRCSKQTKSPTFAGKMTITSKSLKLADEEKFIQVYNNIHDMFFVRTLGIFPEVERKVVDRFETLIISFDNKYNTRIKKLVDQLNKGAKELEIEDKIELKYED